MTIFDGEKAIITLYAKEPIVTAVPPGKANLAIKRLAAASTPPIEICTNHFGRTGIYTQLSKSC